MNKTILITGATGLIGQNIVNKLIQRGDKVIVLTRTVNKAKMIFPNLKDFIPFDFNIEISDELNNAANTTDAVIHLAGENIMAKRWTEEHKHNVIESRVKSTEKLLELIRNAQKKPKIFISASAVGYYGNRFEEVDEDSKKGKGFLSDVTDAWEKSTFGFEKIDIRRVNVRIGIVLAKDDGALPKLVLPFKFFIGGSLGSGKQWMPWIHIEDLVKIFLFALDNVSVNGVINAVSPNPVTMNELSKTIGKVLNRPSFFKMPSFILKLILGEAASSVLEGAKVKPKKLKGMNFEFQFVDLRKALIDLLK